MKLTKKFSITLLIIAVLSILLLLFTFNLGFKESINYQFAILKKGNIESTISSSGTLNPVTEVIVGTQVSGTIEQVFVDFNDKVKKGQVIAVLDSSLLRMAVDEAQAGVLKAEAQLEEAQANYDRYKMLSEKELIAGSDFQTVKTTLKNAQAGIISAKSALNRAKRNLSYAIIKAPISGTVTVRNVEEGQTVAASFSTPTLFTIAQDMSKMEIKVSVDESDIGQIKEGQNARFTVQAYPEKIFSGKVKQIRVQPTTTANVVNYSVIVTAENKDNLLLPGMTAMLDFIIENKADVLITPNAALRFQPPEAEIAQMQRRMSPPIPQPAIDSINKNNLQMPPDPDHFNESKQLWYLDKDGKLSVVHVQAGISDGTNTEIKGFNIYEGMKVVIGMESASGGSNSAKIKSNSGGPPPPMM
ncbi:MAG: efflux RND transporter periplasmic adaptor subunit [Bacteroidetes bacterium]|nr:efflux RND transporter periplasmic adaptor subunit [Bacteroidota bacterium]